MHAAGAQLDLNRQGYQAFNMDTIEFLVAETMDGKLDLQDSYVYDKGAPAAQHSVAAMGT